MFGLLRKPKSIDRFSSLNPLCAPAVHIVVKEMLPGSTRSWHQVFETEAMMLDERFSWWSKHGGTPDSKSADLARVTGRDVDWFEPGSERTEFSGFDTAFSAVRKIVFADAPALSASGATETRYITTRVLWILAEEFRFRPFDKFALGLGKCFSLFGKVIDSTSWSNMNRTERENKANAWDKGYRQ